MTISFSKFSATYIRLQNKAAAMLKSGNTYIMKRNSLCGKNENNVINAKTGNSIRLARTSKHTDPGISNIVLPKALGMAE